MTLNIAGYSPLRICYVVSQDLYFKLHRKDLARAVRDMGHQVIVLAGEDRERKAIEQEGFVFRPIRFFRGNLNPGKELVTFLDLLRAYRKYRPHIVHQVAFKPIVIGTWAARLTGIGAIVNSITGLGYAFTAGDLKRWPLRLIMEWGFRSVLQGDRVRTFFENPDDRSLFTSRGLVSPAHSRVIPGSGVDPNRFHPAPEPPPPVTILLAARMLRDKGVADLVEAGCILKREGLDFRIVLAGTPDPANPASLSEGELKEWGRNGIADWIGFHNDMPALIAESQIVCLPSYYREGIPVSLIEAASCARPIVTTDAPGCRAIVADGVNGLLVPPKDPVRLAGALRTLIQNPQLRREMGRKGRELVLERFSISHVIEQTLAVYEELCPQFRGK